MIESTLEVGPLTPQELEEVCDLLKAQNFPFEILKDEEAEKAEMTNDYENIADKLGWRTRTYLGQVFYIRMSQNDFQKCKMLFENLGMATEPKENPSELNADITQVHQDAVEQEDLKRLSSRAVAILWAALWFCAMLLGIHFFNE